MNKKLKINRVNWGLPLHWDTHFAKQANLLNGRTIHKIRPRLWKKSREKKTISIHCARNRNKNIGRPTTDRLCSSEIRQNWILFLSRQT